MEVHTFYLLVRLVQLYRLPFADGGQTFDLLVHLAKMIRLHDCKRSSKALIGQSFSLNWLDYMLQMEVQSFDLLVHLAQLTRLYVANEIGTFHLLVPLVRLNKIKWNSTPLICESLSLNRLYYRLHIDVKGFIC